MTEEGFNGWGASKVARELGLSTLFVSDEPAPGGYPHVYIYSHISTLPPNPLVGPYVKILTTLATGAPRTFPYGIAVVPDH